MTRHLWAADKRMPGTPAHAFPVRDVDGDLTLEMYAQSLCGIMRNGEPYDLGFAEASRRRKCLVCVERVEREDSKVGEKSDG